MFDHRQQVYRLRLLLNDMKDVFPTVGLHIPIQQTELTFKLEALETDLRGFYLGTLIRKRCLQQAPVKII